MDHVHSWEQFSDGAAGLGDFFAVRPQHIEDIANTYLYFEVSHCSTKRRTQTPNIKCLSLLIRTGNSYSKIIGCL